MLIGTHRVLSRDVIPKNLGLVIVDEEQRFGVAQKELLRSLRLEVDVLAADRDADPAHPAHVALRPPGHLGDRDAAGRAAGRSGPTSASTTKSRSSSRSSASAARGGQSFYLHNRVETIDEAAARLQELCPELRILVAHGQMRERELEERMLRFLRGDADVLVSTTIIESGLDIPQANTLDRRARRHARARAALPDPRARRPLRRDRLRVPVLSGRLGADPEARARLATLADHTELGAGFAIAMRDLEIRGAGELLGAEQSGHVAAVGFELYVELLNEAVAELSGQRRAAARPVRDGRSRRRLRAGRLHRLRGAEDRPAPAARAERGRGRAARAARLASRTATASCPSPVESLFAIQEAKLKLARVGADYLVFRGGRITVGPLILGSAELARAARPRPDGRLRLGKHEIALRQEDFRSALGLVDALLEAQEAA